MSALHVSTVSGECPAARVCRGLGMVDDVWLNNCGYTESLIHIPFIILIGLEQVARLNQL